MRISPQILELSKLIIMRVQERNPGVIVKSIRITYLVEKDNFDPWFVGTDFCHILQRSTNKAKRYSPSLERMKMRIAGSSSSFAHINNGLSNR
jgi:hypothetical protein